MKNFKGEKKDSAGRDITQDSVRSDDPISKSSHRHIESMGVRSDKELHSDSRYGQDPSSGVKENLEMANNYENIVFARKSNHGK